MKFFWVLAFVIIFASYCSSQVNALWIETLNLINVLNESRVESILAPPFKLTPAPAAVAPSVTPSPVKRDDEEDKLPKDGGSCGMRQCRPRNPYVSKTDCLFWCNDDNDEVKCRSNCKCPNLPSTDNGIWCGNVCVYKIWCPSSRKVACGRNNNLFCARSMQF
jgi:hypothetical protein